MSYLAGNPEDWFSRIAALILPVIFLIFVTEMLNNCRRRSAAIEDSKHVCKCKCKVMVKHMSRVIKPTMWFPIGSDINRAVQALKMAKIWKFLESRRIVLSV